MYKPSSHEATITHGGEMPDNEETQDWEAQYKKLQSKYNRLQTRANSNSREVSELRATTASNGTMLKRLLDGEGDTEFKQSIADQEARDIATGKAEIEVASILDDVDVDFDTDPRLSDARRLVVEIQETGNLALVDQVKTAIAAIGDAAEVVNDDDVQARIDTAVLEDRKEHGRVDTGRTTAPNIPVSIGDLRNLDPRKGAATMKEQVEKSLDQMFLG